VLVWARNVCVIASAAAEPALEMHAVRVAAQLAIDTTIVPEVILWPISQKAAADVQPAMRLWARDRLVGLGATKAALDVHAVGITALHPLLALRVVVVRHRRNVRESTHLGAWAVDVRELV